MGKDITKSQFAAMTMIVFFICLTFGLLHYFVYTGNQNALSIKNDSIQYKLIENKIRKEILKDERKKLDSIGQQLIKRDTVYIDKWHKAKEDAKQAPDTCNEYIQNLISNCDSLINHYKLKYENELANRQLCDSSAAIDSSDISMLYIKYNAAIIDYNNLKEDYEKCKRQKNNWRLASMIEGAYIIFRESTQAISN